MNCRYDILPQEQLILLRCSGKFSVFEAHELLERIWSDPRYSPACGAIADLAGLSFPAVAVSEVKALAKFLRENPKSTSGRVALVFGGALATAMALIMEGIVSPRIPLKAFSTWEGACGYLGVQVGQSALP